MMRTNDHFQGILAFVRAVECGSFSAASRQLGLSPSSVGKTVARLEQRLGVRLFQRTTRRSVLTEEGQAFLDSCQRALDELDGVASVFSERRLAPAGRLRVAAPALYGRVKVLPILAALTQQHPALALDMQFSSRAVDLVEENIDLAIRIGRLDDSTTHVARRLGEQALWLCAAPAYLVRHGTPATREALADHRCIARLRGPAEEDWQLSGGTRSSARLPRDAALRLGELGAIRDAALDGHGVAQMPAWFAADDVKAGRLTVILPALQPEPLPIHALWLRNTRMTARLRLAIDALVEELAPS